MGPGMPMPAMPGPGAGPSPDDLLAQISDLLQQYLSLGGDTPVASEAQNLLDAIHSSQGDAGVGASSPLDALTGAMGEADQSAQEPKTLDAANKAAISNLKATGSYSKKGAKGSNPEQQPVDKGARKKRLSQIPAKT